MKKAYRVKDNRDFQRIFKNKKSFANRQLVIYHLEKPGQAHFRVGLSVGKKIGNAVTRNRIKRYLRQAFLELENEIKPDLDIIIIARQPTKNMSVAEMKKSLTHLLKKQHLLR
ncbi:ribonuclease P protein component [Virgibacillus sp. 179-BFC.A HS]|uniref:Ribonuclease P protein component n=1 Tax=Tigheibacillus jepli TaxID=3035914 RepID=A0ABU5CCS2_9BACI|nr:ribonuclease P protein component [Virgibacillus sp. 179-BFC.A HS]MDY0404121.1 ribonuclease P protein component [Virgibacillus sp. 179-BFC.A HS]